MTESIENVTKEELWNKIKGFYDRWQKDEDEYQISDFFKYLIENPESMCKTDMTPKLKQDIAETYIWDQETCLAGKRISGTTNEVTNTFEYLSIVYDRSKSSIHEAVKEFEHLRPEIAKKCEELEYRRKHLNEVSNMLYKRFNRWFSLREAEEWEKAQELKNKVTESEDYAEFQVWRKAQPIKEQ
jgi:hypothetical protein